MKYRAKMLGYGKLPAVCAALGPLATEQVLWLEVGYVSVALSPPCCLTSPPLLLICHLDSFVPLHSVLEA